MNQSDKKRICVMSTVEGRASASPVFSCNYVRGVVVSFRDKLLPDFDENLMCAELKGIDDRIQGAVVSPVSIGFIPPDVAVFDFCVVQWSRGEGLYFVCFDYRATAMEICEVLNIRYDPDASNFEDGDRVYLIRESGNYVTILFGLDALSAYHNHLTQVITDRALAKKVKNYVSR